MNKMILTHANINVELGEFPFFLKVFNVMDADNKGYVTKQDIEALTVEQVKQMANEVDGDPANTEEYEFALFDLDAVK